MLKSVLSWRSLAPDGMEIPGIITDIAKVIRSDRWFNHPLAGQDVTFDVNILANWNNDRIAVFTLEQDSLTAVMSPSFTV